jgi:hypothetical protein
MRQLRTMSLIVATICLVAGGIRISPAQLKINGPLGSCSEWRKQCELDCGIDASCLPTCQTAHKACMSTGCWNTERFTTVCDVVKE